MSLLKQAQVKEFFNLPKDNKQNEDFTIQSQTIEPDATAKNQPALSYSQLKCTFGVKRRMSFTILSKASAMKFSNGLSCLLNTQLQH